jgi:acetyl esterase
VRSVLRVLSLLVLLFAMPAFGQGPRPGLTEENIVYGNAGGEQLTMDYYRAAGPGPHPVAIIIHGGGFVGGTSKNISEAYCADFLVPAGYAVFSINYRLAPKHPYPAMVDDVLTAIRFLRGHAQKWDADPQHMALVGGSAGGYLSNMAGLRSVGTEAQVQAVVTLYGPSDFSGRPVNDHVQALLGPLIKEKGEEAALLEASPITHVTVKGPPFLLIHGDKDLAVPFDQSTRLQEALRKAGVPCDLIRIVNGAHATGRWHTLPGVTDWEHQMVVWLNKTLHHDGPVGAGIRARKPAAP